MPKTEYLVVEKLSIKDITRIFSKIHVNSITGCWEWTGALNTYEYGCIWYKGKQEMAHRLLWAWLVGPLPTARWKRPDIPELDHIICDLPRCCNPAHLRLVFTVENLERTNSTSAVNRRKTHCIRGHLLPVEPNRASGYGRLCKICRSITGAAYYQRVAKTKQRATRQASRGRI